MKTSKQSTEKTGTENSRTKIETGKVSLCGMMAAASIVVMLLGSALGIGTYAAPLLASITLLPITREYGSGTSLLAYGAIALLGLFLLPDRELSLFFVCFGWYQAVWPHLMKIRSRLLRLIIKLTIYSAMVFLMYGVLAALLGIPSEAAEEALWFNIMLFGLGALTFLLLDGVYARVLMLWEKKWRKAVLRR